MGERTDIVVVGAGIAGLAAAARLAAAGRSVAVLERADAPGGKIRAVPTIAGPCDAGPTVMTMADVFEDLFADCGERLTDHVTLEPMAVIARHLWEDGTRLDLHGDPALSLRAVRAAFGAVTAGRFATLSASFARLLDAFDAPMMRSAEPSVPRLSAAVAARPRLLADMAPHRSLSAHLRARLREPRLAQLLGRYATYVGGSPFAAPALLGLISQAEARGVWRVSGGMHALPRAVAALAERRGARIRCGVHVERLERDGEGWRVAAGPDSILARDVLFAGDPRALAAGLLGPDPAPAVPRRAAHPRSLSACVLAFAARARGLDIAHHTVLFGDEAEEFGALAEGRLPTRGTLYLCAQDRAADGSGAPDGPERFEIILNAPPGLALSDEETRRCTTLILDRLARFGLTFDPPPGPEALTTPAGFEAMFPGSMGSLYGLSPHGSTAALRRPKARTRLPGLWLAGGGTHPGAGVPMAALSGRHAAEAILKVRPSTSPSLRGATPGGTSTPSPTTAPPPSPS